MQPEKLAPEGQINTEAVDQFRDQLSRSVLYLQRLSVLKDISMEQTPEPIEIPDVTMYRDQEYALIAEATQIAPHRGSLYINDGLYSHAVSLDDGGVRTTTARIQTPDQMLAAVFMVADEQTDVTYSPISFSALARTLRGIPVMNRVQGTREEGFTEVFFRAPRGNERADLFAFANRLRQMSDLQIGAATGFSCVATKKGIKLTLPNNRLFQAETYRHIDPFGVGIGFSSPDGRYVRQYDVSDDNLLNLPDEEVFSLLEQTEEDIIPSVHEQTATPEESTDILSLSGEMRNTIKDLMRRFIRHERNTIRTKRESYLSMVRAFMALPGNRERVMNLMQQYDAPTASQILQAANSDLQESLHFVLSRLKFFELAERGIELFEDARDELEELYPVHVGYGMVYALERAHTQYKELCGKRKLEYDGEGKLIDYGIHPDYTTILNLSSFGGPADVDIAEAFEAVELPIDEVKLLLNNPSDAHGQRMLSILTAIHRAPVVAGFKSLFDVLTFVQYGNAVDINTSPTGIPIQFISTVRPRNGTTYCTIENSGKNPPAEIVEQLNNPESRKSAVAVESSHGGSGEALTLVDALSQLVNHTRKVQRRQRFYAGTRSGDKEGFRLRVGMQTM